MWPRDALPRSGITNWSVFTGQRGWQSWMKPPGCNWVYIFAIGSGGGGGRASGGAVSYAAGGGGSGVITRALYPAQIFPDIIYVIAGAGGLGSTTDLTFGAAGETSFIGLAPNSSPQNLILRILGGDGGDSITTGGAGGSATASSNGALINAAIFTSTSGQSGSNGGAVANGSGINISFGASGLCVTGGAGGGCGTGIGGGITGSGLLPTINGAATGGASGNPGFNRGLIVSPGLRTFPMLFSGGCGGGGVSTAITAGRGGDGAYGSGGGGGGSGTIAGAVAGNGGNGGDALIMIGAF